MLCAVSEGTFSDVAAQFEPEREKVTLWHVVQRKPDQLAHPSSQFDQSSLFVWRNIDPWLSKDITKTCLYNFDPLKPHFYIVKLGFTGVYIFFLFLLKNIDCGYSLEPPRWGGSNEYQQSMFWAEIWKNIKIFIWKFSVFGGEIFNIFE